MLNIKTFIERPVLSLVLSIFILIIGLIALLGLPIEQFPDIAPPTVEVYTSYPGANAETVEKSVVVPLEEAINGVEDMTYISSSSSNSGDAYLTIYFKQGTDADMAAVNVQNRVATAQGLLPQEVTKIGVTTNKQQKSMLKAISLYSPTDEYDQIFLDNYLAINVIPRLKRIAGVGQVMLLGSNYSMRIWLKPDKMSQYGLVPSDVEGALAAQNIESATGAFGEDYEGTFQYKMKYKGRLSTPEEFGNIVIKSKEDGEVLRLKEIATVNLGTEAYNYHGWLNGHDGSIIMVYQTAGSNASEVIGEIDRQIAEMSKQLPRGTAFADVYSTKTFLDASFRTITGRYVGCVIYLVRRRPFVWGALAVSVAALAILMSTTKTGLVPDEDTGAVMVNVTTAPGSSLAQTSGIIKKIERRLDSIPEIEYYSGTAGYGLIGGAGASAGMFILQLKNWDERKGSEHSASAVAEKINAIGADIPDASIFAMTPPLIDGYGVSNGLEINLQDQQGGSVDSLCAVGNRFAQALMQRPEIATAYSTFSVNYPQYSVEVDAAKCLRAGTSADAVLSTLAGYYGGSYASNFNRFSKLYRVMLQAAPEYRINPASLDKIYTSTASGMAPLSQFVTIMKSYGAESTSRFNLYSSMLITADAAEGYSSGDAIKAVSEVAATSLPRGYGYEYSGISRETSQTTNNTLIIFAVCFVFVYLILCALYESFLLPLSVILSVPFGLMGSFIFAKLMGLENNIYLQTGLIMLIGLLAKTAILITEYAVERRRHGMSLIQAAVSAAKARFRPILMTVLAMIFGLLPLMFSTGAGANGNSSLGTGVIGGLLIGSLALIFFVPALFVAFQALQERIKPTQFVAQQFEDLEIMAEKEQIKKKK